MFVTPFVVGLIREHILNYPPDLSENFTFVVFVFLPVQIAILLTNLYVLLKVGRHWKNLRPVWMKITSLILSIIVVGCWIVGIIALLSNLWE